jgi:hypothetical protein
MVLSLQGGSPRARPLVNGREGTHGSRGPLPSLSEIHSVHALLNLRLFNRLYFRTPAVVSLFLMSQFDPTTGVFHI